MDRVGSIKNLEWVIWMKTSLLSVFSEKNKEKQNKKEKKVKNK